MKARLLALALLAAALVVLAGCGPAPGTPAPGGATPIVVTQIVAGTPIVVTAPPQRPTTRPPATRTLAPAATPGAGETGATRTPGVPPATAAPATAAPLTAVPTAGGAPPATLAPPPEARLVELEWPPEMRLGDSEVLRVALVPDREGYVVTTELPGHQVVTETLPVPRPPGYDLAAVARLEGAGFAVEPAGEQLHALPPGQPVAWRWTVSPQSAGRQSLVLNIRLRWTPQAGSDAPPQEMLIFGRGLRITVTSFLGLSTREATLLGVLGLLAGGGLSLPLARELLRRRRGGLLDARPDPALVIERRADSALGPAELEVLRALFRRYARITVEAEFHSGYSGARTFLILPVRADGRADAYTIAKLGARDAIAREHANYETFVKDTLPPVTARIQEPPVTAGRRAALAALRYTFIGEPGRTPLSLRAALLDDPDPAWLEKLFATFGPNWWLQRRPFTFRLAEEYDRMLPAHYALEPARGANHAAVLDGRSAPGEDGLALGDVITLRHFHAVDRRADGHSLALAGEPPPGHPPLRLRWQSLTPPADGTAARVVATRDSLLRESIAACDLHGRPDPFAALPAILAERVMGTQSTIHGDLNLENILVGPGGLVWLIDFARTREGHPLFDFAHLEAELIAHVLAAQLPSADDYLALLATGGGPLLAGLHALAARCLRDAEQPREYALARTVACLGALKHVNLTAHGRELLYLTAATAAAAL